MDTILLMTMPDFTSPEVWMSLLTLTFLEIVLGVDNIIFISIASAKLPDEQQKKATTKKTTTTRQIPMIKTNETTTTK